MTGARWIFRVMIEARLGPFPGARPGVYTPDGPVIAEVSSEAMTTKQADAFQRALANRLDRPIGSYRVNANRNPTLVHHGLAGPARWHIVTARDNAPIADLYGLDPNDANKLAHHIANTLGVPVHVLSNVGQPKDIGAHSLLRTRSGSLEYRPTNTNPATPVAGQVWRGIFDGASDRVLRVSGSRVQILHMETGNREWLQLGEFVATHRPEVRARSNPERSKEGYTRRRIARQHNPSAGMPYADAVHLLGADHVDYLLSKGPEEIKNRAWGQWIANNLQAMEAYTMVLHHHFPEAKTNPESLDENTRKMILGWLPSNPDDEDIERLARWMRDVLRAGGIRDMRRIVRDAISHGRGSETNPISRVIDKRSVRTSQAGMLVGCRKGHWHPGGTRGRQCDEGMRLAETNRNPARSIRARRGRKIKRRAYGSSRVRRAAEDRARAIRAGGTGRSELARYAFRQDSRTRRLRRRALDMRGGGFLARRRSNPRASYILEIVGDKFQAARAAADRGIPAAFVREVKHGRKTVTRVKIGAQFGDLAAAWYAEGSRGKVGALRAWYSSNPNPQRIAVGDRVKYSAAWLKSTGTYAGAIPHARGVVTAILPGFGGQGLATIAWDREGVPEKVLIANLVKIGAIEHNPARRTLSVPEKHQLKIARDSLKYSPAMLAVVGGPTHEEAREIIYRLTGKYPNPARTSRLKSNPSTELERAKATFRKWHEFDSHHITRVKGPDHRIPKTLVKLGDLVSVVYRSNKYNGQPELYEHKTKRPHPVLASDPDGRHVHIVGGNMKITADGLVN